MLTTLAQKVKRLEDKMLPKPEVLTRYELIGRELGETDASFDARCLTAHDKGCSVIALIPAGPKPPIPPPPDFHPAQGEAHGQP